MTAIIIILAAITLLLLVLWISGDSSSPTPSPTLWDDPPNSEPDKRKYSEATKEKTKYLRVEHVPTKPYKPYVKRYDSSAIPKNSSDDLDLMLAATLINSYSPPPSEDSSPSYSSSSSYDSGSYDSGSSSSCDSSSSCSCD